MPGALAPMSLPAKRRGQPAGPPTPPQGPAPGQPRVGPTEAMHDAYKRGDFHCRETGRDGPQPHGLPPSGRFMGEWCHFIISFRGEAWISASGKLTERLGWAPGALSAPCFFI